LEAPDASTTIGGSSPLLCPSARVSEPCAGDCTSFADAGFLPVLGCLVEVLGNFEDNFLFLPFENGLELLLLAGLGVEADFALP